MAKSTLPPNIHALTQRSLISSERLTPVRMLGLVLVMTGVILALVDRAGAAEPVRKFLGAGGRDHVGGDRVDGAGHTVEYGAAGNSAFCPCADIGHRADRDFATFGRADPGTGHIARCRIRISDYLYPRSGIWGFAKPVLLPRSAFCHQSLLWCWAGGC